MGLEIIVAAEVVCVPAIETPAFEKAAVIFPAEIMMPLLLGPTSKATTIEPEMIERILIWLWATPARTT